MKANMTHEHRIEELEKKVTRLSEHLLQLNRAYTHSSGADIAFKQAVLALLTSTRPGGLLDAVLPDLLAGVEADAVFRGSDDHLDGLQEAQGMIRTARKEAHRLSAADMQSQN